MNVTWFGNVCQWKREPLSSRAYKKSKSVKSVGL